MTFIRVTRLNNGNRVDLNSAQIISVEQLNGEGKGSLIQAADNLNFEVKESARQIRAFIKKAQGQFEDTVVTVDVPDLPLNIPGLLGQGS